MPATPRPAALYLDLDGLDASPGHALLARHGVDVLRASEGPHASELHRVVALMVGYDPVGATWFDALPNLRLVATHSAGYDMVDVTEVRRRRLRLANVPGMATEEVAVHAFAMTLALVRELPGLDADVRAGRWLDPDRPFPRVPSELTLGIVGLGRIGRTLASLAGPVFEAVTGFDPQLPPGRWPDGVARVGDLDALLGASDCVSLHLPLTPETTRIVDASRLAAMRRGSLLVNVSRGELVDEDALAAALHEGHLRGAACDVLADEPPTATHPLLRAPRTLLTPHVGYLSASSMRRYAETPARNVVELLERGEPGNPVALQAY